MRQVDEIKLGKDMTDEVRRAVRSFVQEWPRCQTCQGALYFDYLKGEAVCQKSHTVPMQPEHNIYVRAQAMLEEYLMTP